MAFWDTRAFKSLQKKWYQKLAQTGFRDIERMSHLHTETANFKDYEAVQEFYSQISRYSNYGKFDSTDEALIWALFVDGKSLRYIGNLVNLSHMSIKRILDKHKKLMKETVYE
jgi:hypothetical protein